MSEETGRPALAAADTFATYQAARHPVRLQWTSLKYICFYSFWWVIGLCPLAICCRAMYGLFRWARETLFGCAPKGAPDLAPLPGPAAQLERANAERVCTRICSENFVDGVGVVAATGHYIEFWCRDAFFTCWGFLTAGRAGPVRDTLATLAKHQRADGMIPLRLGMSVPLWCANFIGLKAPMKALGCWLERRFGIANAFAEGELLPKYVDDKCGANPVDVCSEFVILAWMQYANSSKGAEDLRAVRALEDNMDRALRWLAAHCDDGLLVEQYFGTWHDALTLTGPVLFSNVLFWQAVKCSAAMKAALGREAEAAVLREMASALRERILAGFWSEARGHLTVQPGMDIFHTDGNALAILFGLVGARRAKLITKSMDALTAASAADGRLGVPICHPQHPPWNLFWIYYAIDLEHYQRGNWLWSWVNFAQIAAKVAANGSTAQRHEEEMRRLDRAICQHDTVYEIYERSGAPAKATFYASEPNFSWSAGLYLFAAKTLEAGRVPIKFL